MKTISAWLLSLFALAVPSAALAQAYPTKPIRVIVPYATGGATDLTARLVGQKMQAALKQNVIVENRPGAGGVIGADVVAKAPPDGYTVLVGVPAEMAILPQLQKVPYNVARDFAPVTLAAVTPLILVVHPSLPVKTVKELVAFVRARPGQVSYASAGTGGVQHLAAELLKITTKIDMVHVPYKGAGPVMPDLIGGHIPMFFSGMPPAMPHVRAGKLRPLAVTTAKRSPAAPDVPTMVESGMQGFDISNWFAYFVPASTPANVISTLNTEVNRGLQFQDVKDKLASVGAETVGTTPEALGKFVRAETEKFARLIKASGAKATD
ncbi:MAG TPA: tripartite tricarboxylate transporter substrate binding protein [Burkholderiales bacterium]|nr:tripartite tricarboxylate transporter substrate binding protein [Burkholderiales bacterium]